MGPEMASEEELASRREVGSMNTGGHLPGRLKEKIRAPSSCSPFWISSFRTTSDNFNYRYSCRVEEIQDGEPRAAEEEEFTPLNVMEPAHGHSPPS